MLQSQASKISHLSPGRGHGVAQRLGEQAFGGTATKAQPATRASVRVAQSSSLTCPSVALLPDCDCRDTRQAVLTNVLSSIPPGDFEFKKCAGPRHSRERGLTPALRREAKSDY